VGKPDGLGRLTELEQQDGPWHRARVARFAALTSAMLLGMIVALALAPPASAREVATGVTARVAVDDPPSYTEIVWVEPRGDDEGVELVALHVPARVGDSYDIVDERGFLGRARVTRVEQSVCGALTYARARAQLGWPGLPRRIAGAVVALGPARGRPAAARVLRRDERGGSEDPARLLIDLDGDGEADLARRLTLECGLTGGRSTACVETWARDESGWKRVARAEVGPCD
jgi:hypothetical protein